MNTRFAILLFALVGAMNAAAGTFTLVDRAGGKTYGPFEYVDGQELYVANRTLVLSIQTVDLSIAEQRARAIILPSVEMREASVRDAVDFFREAALAAAGPNRTPNIIVDVSDPNPITLNLRSVSLFDALTFSAEVCACHLRWEGNAVVFTDKK